jgi:hypothetical protein
MLEQIILGFVGMVTGGGLISYLNYRKEKKVDDRSFDAQELEKYKKENWDQKVQIRFLQSRTIEAPVIRWKIIDGRFEYVSNYAVLRFFEPLGIAMKDILGQAHHTVFANYPMILNDLLELEKQAKEKGQAAKMLDLKPMGRYFTFKIKYVNESNGIIYECQLIDEKIITR